MPEWLGTLPQWLTFASFASFLGIILRYRVALIKLANEEKADVRDTLMEAVEHLTGRVKGAEDRQRECEKREAELRSRVSELEDEVTGLKRQVARYSADQLMILEDRNCPSPDVSAAARRVKRHTEPE